MTETQFEAAPAEEGRNRRPLLLAGGAVGVLVLAAGGFLLLHQGGSSDESFTPVVHHALVKGKTATTSKAPVKRAATLPAATKVKIGRDPFAALYIVPAAPAPGTNTTSTTTSTTTSATSAPSAAPATAAYVLTLTKVTSDPGGAKLFTFTYGKTTKTVLPAQRFGNYGELVVLSYVKNLKTGAVTGAVLQVGDDNPIEVPIGVKTSVQ